MFVLSIAELGFTVDSFQYLQKTHTWASKTERARLAFLIFSSARTIFLAAVYMGFHCAQKFFHSMFHTVRLHHFSSSKHLGVEDERVLILSQIFLVLSTIFWIISGVLIHQMWGTILCNQGVGRIKGGLTECHELKIIEIIAWVLAAVSVLACIPVLMQAAKRRKRQAERKTHTSG